MALERTPAGSMTMEMLSNVPGGVLHDYKAPNAVPYVAALSMNVLAKAGRC